MAKGLGVSKCFSPAVSQKLHRYYIALIDIISLIKIICVVIILLNMEYSDFLDNNSLLLIVTNNY